LLWLASLCVTDIVRHSAFVDYVRGWSNIAFTFAALAALWSLLYGRPRRLLVYGWGLVVGGLLHPILNPVQDTLDSASTAWKFGIAYALSLGVFLLTSRKECRGHWPITLAVVMGMINMVMGSRAMGGICLAAAFYLFVNGLARKKNPEASRLKATTVMALALAILLSVVTVMWMYGSAASAGYLGQDAKDKYEEESSGKYGVLVGGRPELLAEIPAIYDSPILGHGSWAKQRIYLIEERRALQLLGYQGATLISREQLKEGLIPAHSIIFQAWVDAGILGAVFWMWIFAQATRVLTRVYPATAELVPEAAFLTFLLMWDILFSPYGAESRYAVPYSIVLIMSSLGMSRQQVIQTQTSKNAVGVTRVPRKRRVVGARASGPPAGLPRVKPATVDGIGDAH
jgi:O-antigen ligase